MGQFYDQIRTIERFWVAPDWLSERMLFLSGPRQVGKTTLVQSRLCPREDAYYNWDHRGVRSRYLKDPDLFAATVSPWICFDEIHKRPKWKDILKGAYDTYKGRFHFVVTGSAKLEPFKRSGDSLAGRYFQTHLFPIHLPDFQSTDFEFPHTSEDLIRKAADLKDSKELESLLSLGGFPEPFFKGSAAFWKRWSGQHRDLIIQEDVRDLSRVIELDKMDALLDMLQPSLGSPLSHRNLGLDLEASHNSVKRWLQILNTVHLVFPLPPYSKNIRRSFKVEKKWYFTDWSQATRYRFENFVASSLSRAAQLYSDRFGEKISLHYIRTHDGAEVDFLLCRGRDPWLLVEAKEGKPDLTSAVHRFSRELGVPAVVVTERPGIYKRWAVEGDEGCRRPFGDYLSGHGQTGRNRRGAAANARDRSHPLRPQGHPQG